jgi:hypothetical protein
MFSRSKGKSTKRKGQKSTSRSDHSANEEPENLGFLYSIDALETIYDEHNPRRILSVGGSKGNDIAQLWFPPIRKHQFSRRPGHLYRWPGEDESEKLEGDERPANLKKFQVASVFFQAKQDNFLAVSRDCTKHDIANEEYGWSHDISSPKLNSISSAKQSAHDEALKESVEEQKITRAEAFKDKEIKMKYSKIKRGLSGFINETRVSAMADTGSAQNMISAEHASDMKLQIQYNSSSFRLGNSKKIQSIGKFSQEHNYK